MTGEDDPAFRGGPPADAQPGPLPVSAAGRLVLPGDHRQADWLHEVGRQLRPVCTIQCPKCTAPLAPIRAFPANRACSAPECGARWRVRIVDDETHHGIVLSPVPEGAPHWDTEDGLVNQDEIAYAEMVALDRHLARRASEVENRRRPAGGSSGCR